MAEYFKLTFYPYQKQWIEQRRRTDLNFLIGQYAQSNFAEILNQMKESQKVDFLNVLSLVVLSHRHNKEESINKKPSEK
jgi:hypothetical protein